MRSKKLTVAEVICVERCSDPNPIHDNITPVEQIAATSLEYPTEDKNFDPVARRGERQEGRSQRLEIPRG